MTADTTPATLEINSEFADPTANILIKSSDGVSFRVHD
jgi:hypothetical protein